MDNAFNLVFYGMDDKKHGILGNESNQENSKKYGDIQRGKELNILLIPAILGIILLIVSLVILPQWRDDTVKIEAKKMIDFRNAEHSCSELKTLYLDYYYKKYHSMTNINWYNEIRNRLIQDNCVDAEQLNNIEFIDLCKDGGTTGCEISKLENPELYKDFNFRTALKNLNSTKEIGN